LSLLDYQLREIQWLEHPTTPGSWSNITAKEYSSAKPKIQASLLQVHYSTTSTTPVLI
jgi:hypothetical protein